MNLNDLKKKRIISKEAELKVLKDTAFQLGRVLEQARTIKGTTQSELANKIDSTQSVIARIENGGKLPSLPFLQRIADAFETYLIPPKFGFMEEPKTVIVWHIFNQTNQQSYRPSNYRATTSINNYEHSMPYATI